MNRLHWRYLNSRYRRFGINYDWQNCQSARACSVRFSCKCLLSGRFWHCGFVLT
jgi:hypothetical protein